MVELNNKLLAFTFMFNVIVFSIGLIIPQDLGASFSNTNNYTSLPNTNMTNNSSYVTVVSSGWDSIWSFLSFILFGGIIGVTDIPFYIQFPLIAFFWVINIFCIAEIVSWARELIGLT